MENSIQLNEFVRQLQGMAAQQFPIAQVSDFLRQVRLGAKVLNAYTFYHPLRYTRNLIYKSPQFELLLLCWGPLQESPIHGHEGEKCWMRVEEGMLCFTNYTELDGVPVQLKELSSVTGSVGFVDGPAGIHRVKNPSNQQAQSLHLYARPFAICDVYDNCAHEKSRRKISYDTMYGKPVKPEFVLSGSE